MDLTTATTGAMTPAAGAVLEFFRLLAQVDPPTPEATVPAGTVGHLISAVLQTLGVYLQSRVLERFDEVMHALGFLLWLFAATGAVYTLAVHHAYKRALYFLIAPAFFYILLDTRVIGSPTIVQFGDRSVDLAADAQLSYFDLIGDSPLLDSDPQVTWLYAQVDRFVSTSVQAIVSLLVDTGNRRDLLFLAREKALSRIVTAKVGDPGFLKLLAIGVMGECSELTNARREVALIDQELQNIAQGAGGPARAAFLNNRRNLLVSRIVLLDAREFQLERSIIDFIYTLGVDPARRDFVRCSDVWNYTRVAVLQYAHQALDAATTGEPGDGIPWPEVRDELEQALANGDDNLAAEIVAAYILRNTVSGTAHGAMMGQIMEHAPMNSQTANTTYGWQAWGEGEGLLVGLSMFAGTIPYIQGLLLFLLAGMMPFFIVMIIMPNRAHSVFMWVALWAWVKSWDIGFAVIYFVRDVLWSFLSNPAARAGAAPINFDWNDPNAIFQVMNEFDPTANMTTYYVVISTLTFAVPVLTAHFFLGASKVLSSFSNILEHNPQRFAQQVTGGELREPGTKMEQAFWQGEHNQAMQQRNAFMASGGGYTETGVKRSETGEAGLQRRAEGQFRIGRAQAHTSARMVGLKGQFASLDNRGDASVAGSNSRDIQFAGPMADQLNFMTEQLTMSNRSQYNSTAAAWMLSPGTTRNADYNHRIPMVGRAPKTMGVDGSSQ